MTNRWADALTSFLYLASFALIVALLSRGQDVLIPLALAGFLAFILTPFVKLLERRLYRPLAVALAMVLTLGLIGGFGYLLNRQLNDLAANMPAYSRAIRVKFAALRETHGSLASIQQAVDKVSQELDRQQATGAAAKVARTGGAARAGAQPVQVVEAEPTDLERLQAILEPVFEPLATAIIVLVLTVFMLLQREDLRNRFIRLVGQGRMSVTTRTLDEAAHRISQFLVTQTLINTVFGTVIAVGLMLIGLPYAVLWGFCAALLRFVPFIGVVLATVMPTAIAFVQFEAWAPTMATLGLFLAIDLITAHVAEPLLVGHRTGVSSLALLVMALLWTWLWGPIGLLLSTPITVCLVALGKHVPAFEFLAITLGDTPPLSAHVVYYQRLLAGDDDEAEKIVERQVTKPLEEVYDEVLLPGLVWATRDLARDDISEAEHQFVLTSTRTILNEFAEAKAEEAKKEEEEADAAIPLAIDRETPRPARLLGMPARGAADVLALEMLGRLVSGSAALEQASPAILVAELIERIRHEAPDAICVSALPPGGLHRARYLCKRIRAAVPGARILVLRPALEDNDEEGTLRLRDAGADTVVGSLSTARMAVERFRTGASGAAALPQDRAPLPSLAAEPLPERPAAAAARA
jgi:predicted PurR-regulated permease PerM